MSREIPDSILEQLYSLNPNSVDLVIARVYYGEDVTYLVSNYVNITYDGQEYTAAPFKIVLPDDKESEDVAATLEISDVQGVLYGIIRNHDSLNAEFELISRATDLSFTSISVYPNFKLTSATWNTSTATFTLNRDDATIYSFPKDLMDNTTLPNLY